MKKAVVFLFLCVAAAPAAAQTLTLEECRAAAVEHNRTLRNSRLDLDAASQTHREAFTNYFPQISASGGLFQATARTGARPISPLPQMGTLPVSMVKRGIVGSVTAVQPLFAGLKIVTGNKLARLGEEVGRLQLQQTEAEVRERTDACFWQVVSLRDNLSTLDAVERQLAEIRRQVELSVKAGLVTNNDLLRVELRQQEIASNRLKVENGLKVSKMLLAQHIGVDWHGFDVGDASSGSPRRRGLSMFRSRRRSTAGPNTSWPKRTSRRRNTRSAWSAANACRRWAWGPGISIITSRTRTWTTGWFSRRFRCRFPTGGAAPMR